MEKILRKIEVELVPRINQYYGNLAPAVPNLDLFIMNNNEQIPIGMVEHLSNKWDIADMYRMANPNPLTTVAPYRVDINNVSRFFQTRRWMLCPNPQQCLKKTIVYKPDLAIIYEESPLVAPLNAYPYRVPLFIIKVEGAKDVWGLGEQEHKVMEEAVSTLAFMPDTWVMFIYHNRFEFWHFERNAGQGTVDVTSYPVYVQRGGEVPFKEQLEKITTLMIGILVRQLVRNGPVIRLSMAEYRLAGLQAYHYPTQGPSDVCRNCWVLPQPLSATNHCQVYQNNPAMLPQFE